MNFRALLFTALCLAGPALSPAVAQLIHISVDNPEGFLRFKTDDASIPWNTSGGFITQLDLTYNSQEKVGALDPGRNYWRMRVENPSLGRNFTITQPFHWVNASEQALVFATYTSTPTMFVEAELRLVFDSSIPTDGSLPQFPLPPLGTTEYTESQFRFWSGHEPFNVPHLAETYGEADIESITVTMTPIPEPSVYGLAALAMMGVAVGLRRRKAGSAADPKGSGC